MHRIHRPAGGRRCDHRIQTAGENTEAALFAFHIDTAVSTQLQEVAVTLPLRPHHQRRADHEDNGHRPQQGSALTAIAHRITERKAQRGGDQEDSQHLYDVSQRGRVFERMRRVGIKEATAVGPEHFDRLLRRHRTHRQHLFHPFKRSVRRVGQEILQRPLLDKEQGNQQRNRQQHPQGDAREINPGVTQRVNFLTGKGAGQGEDHRDTAGGREEVLHR
ncbi:hypothetical protein D3C71_1397510 [compost metagenome]